MILSSNEIRKRLGIAIVRRSMTIDSTPASSGEVPAPDSEPSCEDVCHDKGDIQQASQIFRSNIEKGIFIANSDAPHPEGTLRFPSGRGSGGLVIDPYDNESQQPASYDLRAAYTVALPRNSTTLVPSLEWIELPADLAATLRCRSSYGRRGVILTGGFVDPGFRGQLTLSLINMGPEEVHLSKGDRVVQMILHQVCAGGELYEGRYQDSHGAVGAR